MRARILTPTLGQILVADGLVAKLGDFGESRALRDGTMTMVGTPMYWCAKL